MGTAAYSIHCWLITRLYVFYHKRYGIDDTHRLTLLLRILYGFPCATRFAVPYCNNVISLVHHIAMRLLSATGEKHIYDETSVTLTCEGYEFKAKGKTVVQDGWKAIERCFKETLKSKEKDEPEHSLPSLNEKDILSSVDSSVTEHYTSPPKPYTEDSLLSAMETAGNAEFDDDTEKKGLGTPATRAGIIEKLVKGGFVERKGKSLVPTKDGNNLVCVLPEQITSPSMTAEWENTRLPHPYQKRKECRTHGSEVFLVFRRFVPDIADECGIVELFCLDPEILPGLIAISLRVDDDRIDQFEDVLL